MNNSQATAIGFCAIGLWAFAALLVDITRNLPVFQVLAAAFFLGGCALGIWGRVQTRSFAFIRQSWKYYAFAISMIFINNIAFLTGLRHAPIVTANLINYLWPLIIILLSIWVSGKPLRWHHLLGGALGFGGCVVLMADGDWSKLSVSSEYWYGYANAFIAATSFAIYSVGLSRFFANVPTPALSGVFIGVSTLCLAMSLFTGSPGSWPEAKEIAGIMMMGLGMLGAAFACWDYGAKKGDVRVMGAVSYLTPLLSTLILAALGGISVSPIAWVACVLVITGALLGSARELFGLKSKAA